MNLQTILFFNEKDFEINGKKLPFELIYKIFDFQNIDDKTLAKYRNINSSFAHYVEYLINLKVDNYNREVKYKEYSKKINNNYQDDKNNSQLKETLIKIFSNPNNLGRFLAIYEDETKFKEKFFSIFDVVKEICKSCKYLIIVTKYLNENQIRVVYENLQNKLIDIIKTSFNFSNVLCNLNEKQREAVYDAVKGDLKDIIKNVYDFRNVICYLNENQITAVCDSLKSNVKDIIKNSADFRDILCDLDEYQIKAICNSFKSNLKDIIKNGNDFSSVIRYLNESQIRSVSNLLKDNLKDIIKDSYDIRDIIIYLNESRIKFRLYRNSRGLSH